MKKTIWIMMTLFLMTVCFGVLTIGQKTYAAEATARKKAILVVSFGTTFADTRKITTEAVEDKIKAAFPDYEVRHAFTSRIIIKRLADRDGLHFDTEKQALDKLKADGYKEIIIQPLHMEAGDEYAKLMHVVDNYKKSFEKISVGRPVLYYTGQEGEKPDDYLIAIKAMQTQFPKLGKGEAIALMGHGGLNPSNTAYAALQMKIQDAGLKNVFVFTVEGYPTIENVIKELKDNKIKKVTLMPIMLVAGDHANNDMAGDDKESFKSQLIAAGFKVETYIHGLGENVGIQDIYVQHVKDAITGAYTERSKDRPAIPVIN
ncbi:Sirohydrochlorin cobaltochelatase [Sporomusa ovata DSM 2662]|uniref:Sirohydrochlorin cobaltochelatase CbiK n=2 Tax=Sporomusa ovata TaxID=2378 RepID=A0A0U1L5T4_9FIRM|nr:sirohydrochlorin cobaltochelatase [Sporomusa ovata]EQB25933.1 sirohydrochlorin cobaltochelatase [Sporomusa ovata DSM 2662]CQR74513.1 Sirohydrochlorin cobaltochelatase CbiK [Sporomusa ovata]